MQHAPSTSRSRRARKIRRAPPCRCAACRITRRHVHRAPRKKGYSSRLRAGRGSTQGQGVVKREVVRVGRAGPYRCGTSRRARAGICMSLLASRYRKFARTGLAAKPCEGGRRVDRLSRPANSTSPSNGADDCNRYAMSVILRPREWSLPPDTMSARSSPRWRRRHRRHRDRRLAFRSRSGTATVLEQLRVGNLEGFGLERRQAAVCAAGALLRHCATRKRPISCTSAAYAEAAADCLLVDRRR